MGSLAKGSARRTYHFSTRMPIALERSAGTICRARHPPSASRCRCCDHGRQALYARLPAGLRAVGEDDQPDAVLVQFAVDLPHQLVASFAISFHRLPVELRAKFGISVAIAIAVGAARVILAKLLVRVGIWIAATEDGHLSEAPRAPAARRVGLAGGERLPGSTERRDQQSIRLSAGRPSPGHLRSIHLARSLAAPTASDRATAQRARVIAAGRVSCGHGVCHSTSPR